METGQCEKQPKKPCTEKQTNKNRDSESKEVRPMKEGGSSEDEGVKKVNRLEIPKGVSDRVEERERQIS